MTCASMTRSRRAASNAQSAVRRPREANCSSSSVCPLRSEIRALAKQRHFFGGRKNTSPPAPPPRAPQKNDGGGRARPPELLLEPDENRRGGVLPPDRRGAGAGARGPHARLRRRLLA